MADSNSQDLLLVESEDLPTATRIVSFRGKEGLSQLYELELGLLVRDRDFETDKAIHRRATVTLNLGGEHAPQVFNGIISSVGHLNEYQDQALYRVVLVPKFWELSQTHHSRIFTHKSIPDIITHILQTHGFKPEDFTLRMQAKYPEREHVCQYKESDYAFVCRWLEREGAYFYFEQGSKSEKLVITDATAHQQSLRKPPIRVVPLSDDHMAREAFHVFQMQHVSVPATVESADYNYYTPDVLVQGKAEVVEEGHGAIRRWEENAANPTRAKALASHRAGEIKAHQKLFHGQGRVFNLRPGYIFNVEEHVRSTFNQQYLCLELEHRATQASISKEHRKLLGLDFSDEYTARVTAIPQSQPYRPRHRTPWPHIDSCESAVVDGPRDSEFAQIDDQGRYRIRVRFDENEHDAGKASTWVRMLQPHAGATEGMHFPLRKGTEVLLIFLGGDPDRPVIAGGVPDPQRPSPVNKTNNTQNIIQTGQNNLIRLEDHNQHIYISTPPKNTYLHLGTALDGYHLVVCTQGHGRFFCIR